MLNKNTAFKFLTAMLALLTMASVCLGQSYWKRIYGWPVGERANAITPTPDGNYIVAGSNSVWDVVLLKIKPTGDTIWSKSYGGPNNDWASAIAPTLDGNFIVAGGKDFGYDLSNNARVYLLKIRPDGDTLWTKTFKGDSSACANAITPTPDGNFIVAGYTASYITGGMKFYLLKINTNGDTLWTKTYGISKTDIAYAITSTPDGNFIVVGRTEIPGTFRCDIYIIKINTDGDTLWTKTYGGINDDIARAVMPTPDGNFIIAGSTVSSDITFDDVYLLKIKPNGDTLWTKIYGGKEYDYAYALAPATDGNIIVAGHTESFGLYDIQNVYLLKINPNGDTVWTNTFSAGGGIDAITPTPDGNFLAAGGSNYIVIVSLIDDRYAKKDSLFTFKIPMAGDTLNHTYTLVKVPSGMTVSPGGTLSWMPKTDSAFIDHVEIEVADETQKKDVLTFNIFVNCKGRPVKSVSPLPYSSKNNKRPFSVITNFSSGDVRFSLPPQTLSVGIYDMRGQLLENLSIKRGQANWQPNRAAGRYIARAIIDNKEAVRPFVFVK
jgi:uncharacterized delta-60 repeat protein